jgi:hypothetical protein
MPTKTLRELASIRTGYPFRGRAERVGDGGCVLVQVGNINGEAGEMAGEPTRITAPANWREHVLHHGDVLVIARGPRNDAATFTWESGQAVAASHIIILRTEGRIAFPEYLTWFLNLSATQAKIRAMRSESSVPFVAVEAMGRLQVPVPSIEVQNTIARVQKLSAKEQRLMEEIRRRRCVLVDGLVMGAVRRDVKS